MLLEHVLSTVGLVLGIAGGFVIYVKGFPQPDFGPVVMALSQNAAEKADAEQRLKLHVRFSHWGVGLLIAGFIVQVVATWV